MKLRSLIILSLGTILSFSCKPKNVEINLSKVISQKENEFMDTQTDSLGPVILVIDFKQKAFGEDLKTFEDGFIPWISVDNPNSVLKNLLDADLIVLPFKTAKIIIDYPLNFPATFKIKSKGLGFSRKELITEISKKYHEIYKLEESSANTKTVPLKNRKGIINRNQTDGKFGIWGHDISDLDLSQIEVYKNSKGEIILTLGIES